MGITLKYTPKSTKDLTPVLLALRQPLAVSRLSVRVGLPLRTIQSVSDFLPLLFSWTTFNVLSVPCLKLGFENTAFFLFSFCSHDTPPSARPSHVGVFQSSALDHCHLLPHLQ